MRRRKEGFCIGSILRSFRAKRTSDILYFRKRKRGKSDANSVSALRLRQKDVRVGDPVHRVKIAE